MIQIMCETKDTCLLTQLIPFQGDLKKRSDKDIEDLLESLKTEGMLMPFAVWESDNGLKILDGHGRYAALVKASMADASILEQEFPVVRINAATEGDARKALLQIVSTYGKIYKAGVITFAAPLINYNAPIVNSTVVKSRDTKKKEGMVMIKINCRRDMVQKLTAILKDVDGVELV